MSVTKGTAHWLVGTLAVSWCFACSAAGVLKLSRTELRLKPDGAASQLWVENIGDSPLYLDVTQQRVANPGQVPERLEPVEEVPRPTLLVLPRRLALSPGQRYPIALKALAVPQRTQVWRVTFRPRERIVVDGGRNGDTAAPLFVSVGYGVVIYQLRGEER
ncbi:hypothetical protein [Burkholderia sp. 22PA0106]|uniref:hypothetical protein n=1 Tax=Burkholderia sp. 22PA0106 TaxID=3237371 RepID=UPI0039C0C2B3